ncbi:MAG: TRAP transporter substrate-binding protein DctP [Calditrichaeota bacterium]|nr:TRAP transporter substrate-binding protein DctP [Calditrichota bacterium]
MTLSARRSSSGLCILLLALACLVSRPALAEDPATLIKFATVAPRNSTWMNIMEELDTEVRSATANRVGFKFYPGGVQGDELDVIRKIKINQIQAAGFTGVGLGAIQPAARILDLPFLFTTAEQVDAVREGMFDRFASLFREKNFELLGWAEVGFVHFFSQQPIRTLDDLRQQKMWLWEGDPLASAYFKELGLKPVPLALPDVLTSFQTGLINAAYASPYGASVLQWQSRVNHVSDLAMANASGAVLVSDKAWNKLSAADQVTVRQIARKHLRRLTLESRRENQEAMDAFLKAGITQINSSESEHARFEEIGTRVQNALAGDLYSRELLNDVRQALAGATGN